MSNPARSERDLICDLFTEYGPDEPTLCAGWTTRDLAAHIAVRERRPDAAAGILIGALSAYGDRVRTRAAAGDWAGLVATIRTGPPRLSPMRLGPVDRLANTVEFFVHVEDVRRARADWQPRTLDADLRRQLLAMLTRGARLLARSAPCGLVLHPSDHQPIRAKKGEPSVTVTGDIGELVLFMYGRQAHTRVDLQGPADLVETIRSASFGV
ncbi:MAG: TIGR03085 family metal-binding protein [Ilumatobacteraceae bacterium]